MADDKQQGKPSEDEIDEAVADASGDMVKVPDEEESEPANTEGSEAKRP